MKLLLDSHVLLWWLAGDKRRLGSQAASILANNGNELCVSAVSWWELAIKCALNKLEADLPAMRQGLVQRSVSIMSVTLAHAEAAAELPVLHRDPFDHMLVAQAQTEGMQLLTRDKKLKAYRSTVLCV